MERGNAFEGHIDIEENTDLEDVNKDHLSSEFDGTVAIGGTPDSDNDTNCLYCKSRLCDPRLLPCFHVFCSKCIQTCMNNSPFDTQFLCPLCEIPISASRNDGASSFSRFTYVIERQRPCSLQGRLICVACDEAKAVSLCLSCNDFYCPSCKRAHTKMKFSKHHQFVGLEWMPVDNSRSKAFCPAHQSDEMTVYCTDCKQAVCSVCNSRYHSGHSSARLEEIAKQTRHQLQLMASAKFDVAKHVIKSRYEDITEELDETSVNVNASVIAFENYVDHLKQKLDNVKSECVGKIKKEQKELNRNLTWRQTNLEARLKSILLKKKNILKLIENENDTNFLEQYRNIMASVSVISDVATSGDVELYNLEKTIFKRADKIDFKKEDCGELILTEKVTFQVELQCSEFDVSKFGYDTPVGVCPVSDSDVLIFKTHVQLCKEGGVRENPNNIKEQVFDITKDNYGNVYLACSLSILRLDAKGQKVEQIFLPRKSPSGIAAKDGTVLVAFFKDDVLMEYRHTTKQWDEKKVSIRPNKVRVNRRGDIVITEAATGVLLSKNLELRCTISLPETAAANFRGRYGATSRAYQGLSLTDTGYVVISDHYTKSAYVYSCVGNFLQTFGLSYLGSYPTCSIIDDQGCIWVGTYKGNIQRYRLTNNVNKSAD